MADKYRVSDDRTGENKFIVHLPGGKIRSFTQCKRGLFYSDRAAGETVLLNTIEFNTSQYYERDYTRALLAQKLQYKTALPSHRHLVKIVED